METCITLEHADAYGLTIQTARRLTDEEKPHYTKEWQDRIFIGLGDHVDLPSLTWKDVPMWGREPDGSFPGCENVAWIITEVERDALLALNAGRVAAKKDAERNEEIASLEARIRKAEAQKDIPTREEARRRIEEYNDVYNEGGDGYVPWIVDKESYEWAKARLAELKIEKEKQQ